MRVFLSSILKYDKVAIYVILLSLLMLGDGVMSYIAPSIIEEHVLNPFVMGIVIAFSSFVGFICDFFFASRLRSSKFYTIFRKSIMAATLFPIVFLFFGRHVVVFLVAMGIWGLYYELMTFSNFHFVDDYVSKSRHTSVWGIMNSFWSLAWFVAPLLAAYVYDRWSSGPLVLALIFYVSANVGLFFTQSFWNKQKIVEETEEKNEKVETTENVVLELRLWKQLVKKLWPIYIFGFYTTIISSGFWTIGTLLSEDLRHKSIWGVFFFSAWTFPPLIFSFISNPIVSRLRKKKTAFLFGFLSGITLCLLMFIHSVELIVLCTFLSSAFLAIAYPALDAAIQEYVKKLGSIGNDYIGLQSSSTSIAYIFGPIVAGFLAMMFGNQVALGVLGIGFGLISLLCLIVVRREIRLPHEALHALISEQQN